MAMSSDAPQAGSVKDPAEERELVAGPSSLLSSLLRPQACFASVDERALARLEQKLRSVRFRDAAIICEEGDPGGWIFIVTAGEVEVLKKAKDGAMIQVNVLRPGDWGGMMSLSKDMPRSARLVAHGAVELGVLSHDDLASLLSREPSLTMGLLACMSRRLGEDAIHLAATLRYVSATGFEELDRHCSPSERVLLETIRHRVAATESLAEIMDFLFDSVQRVHDCDRLSLMFIEDDGSRAVGYWTRATYEPLLLAADYKEDLAGTSLAESLETGRPRIINDVSRQADERPTDRAMRILAREGIQSSIITPLFVGGKATAFLVGCARSKDAYNDHHALIHRAVADGISQAVEKAYRIEQLTQANNYYAEVLGFVSHELQSPIASMVTDAKLLVEGYLGELNQEQRNKLQRSISKGRYLLTLVRDYLNLARLEDSSLKASIRPGVDVCKQVVEPTIAMIEQEVAAKGMILERRDAEPAPIVAGDVGLLRIALGNLLTNAVKYGSDGGVIRIRVEQEDGWVHLTVWNEGPGFAAVQRSRLFRKFVRLNDPELRHRGGTGVGLYSAWRIMQLHHGRVAAHSERGKWAEFRLSCPVEQPAA